MVLILGSIHFKSATLHSHDLAVNFSGLSFVTENKMTADLFKKKCLN